MARKKTEKPKMPATEEAIEMKAVRLYLTRDVHDEFRVLAAKERTNMAILARRVIEEYVVSKREAK